jgi:hypothetical protein
LAEVCQQNIALIANRLHVFAYVQRSPENAARVLVCNSL